MLFMVEEQIQQNYCINLKKVNVENMLIFPLFIHHKKKYPIGHPKKKLYHLKNMILNDMDS